MTLNPSFPSISGGLVFASLRPWPFFTQAYITTQGSNHKFRVHLGKSKTAQLGFKSVSGLSIFSHYPPVTRDHSKTVGWLGSVFFVLPFQQTHEADTEH
jgi:hypothetical protein